VTGLDALGWVATALFAASYFCKEPRALRLTQALAALVWIAYGIALQAAPVIVANAVVASLAVWSSLDARASQAPGS
jgi:Bacterial inner membrane protein